MPTNIKQVKYIKPSSTHGSYIPLGTIGIVLKYIDNSQTAKLVVDFKNIGKCIVPKNAVVFLD